MSVSAGIFFYSKSTKRYLYLFRTDNKNWSLPGGKIRKTETLFDGLARECQEEIGWFPNDLKLIPIQMFTNKSFTYHTFFCAINDEFVPVLNGEHCGYAWVAEGDYPKPLHPGLFSTINFEVVKDKLAALNKNGA